MSLLDLTIREADLDALRGLVLREDGLEAAAYVLCGASCIQSDPWERRSRRRLTVHAVMPIPSEDAISASERHVTWSTASYVKLLKRANDEGLVPGIVHTHPRGPARFSDQDDRNEKDLLQTACNRNGDQAALVSILLTGDGQVRARLWPDLHGPVDAVAVQVAGRRLAVHSPAAEPADIDFLARQALAFGPSLNAQLKTMRIGIVGCGGTGSATAMLLARLGVGQLALFDDDIVDVTNLNRLHGARRSDADAMRPKVEVVAREITGLGLGVRAVPIRHWIGDPFCRDALKACDVIFGCTDDHDGRLLLNRLAYFYLIPVIDMGLAIDPKPDRRGLHDLTGRVTVLFPDAPCLLCRGIVDPVVARDEGLRRRSPEEYERQKREAYVHGGGDPAPAVVTFTTATACLAVDELLQALTGFRSPGGRVWQRTRRFDRLSDRRPGATILTARCVRREIIGAGVMSSRFSTGRGKAMWRGFALRVLVFLRLADWPELAVRIVERHPTPEELRDGELVVVQDGERRKWVCLRCPGGCGERIQLTLAPHRRPRWLVHLDWLRRPSVTPSVRQLNDCRCHFWIRRGRIQWCSDSAPRRRQMPRPRTGR